jgi:hypothetical protein
MRKKGMTADGLEDLIAKGRGKLEYPQVQVTTFAVFF